MLSYKDNRYDSQEVFLPLLCFLELEAALTVLSFHSLAAFLTILHPETHSQSSIPRLISFP